MTAVQTAAVQTVIITIRNTPPAGEDITAREVILPGETITQGRELQDPSQERGTTQLSLKRDRHGLIDC